MKCYKKVFNKDSLKKNYGFFIFIFVLYFICLFLFKYKHYFLLINDIYQIENALNEILKDNVKNLESINIDKEKLDFNEKKIQIEYKQNKLYTSNNVNNKGQTKGNEHKEIINPSFPPQKTKKKRKKRKKLKQNSNILSTKKIIVEQNNINVFDHINNNLLNQEKKNNLINEKVMKYNEREIN